MSVPGFGHNRDGPDILDELGREAVKLCAKEDTVNLPSCCCLVGFAKLGGGLNQGL